MWWPSPDEQTTTKEKGDNARDRANTVKRYSACHNLDELLMASLSLKDDVQLPGNDDVTTAVTKTDVIVAKLVTSDVDRDVSRTGQNRQMTTFSQSDVDLAGVHYMT